MPATRRSVRTAAAQKDAPAATSEGEPVAATDPSAVRTDAFGDTDTGAALDALSQAVSEPAALLQPSEDVANCARNAAKALFDYALSGRDGAAAASGLAQLHVDSFDAEQIWGQLDMHSGSFWKRIKRLLARAGEEPALLQPFTAAQLNGVREDADGGAEPSGEEPDSDGDAASSDSDADTKPARRSRVRFEDEGAEESAEEEGSDGGGQPKAKRQRKRLPTEDAFLRLDDMEAFVQEAERAAMQGDEEEECSEGETDDEEGSKDADSGLDDGDIESGSDAEMAALLDNANALVGRRGGAKGSRKQRPPPGVAAEGEETNSDDSEAEAGGDMYSSFFDPKSSDDEEDEGSEEDSEADAVHSEDDGEAHWNGEELFDTGEGRDEEPTTNGAGKAQQLLLEDEDEAAVDASESAKRLSKHERRTKQMQERIAAMEAAAMGEKDWFLRGEAQAEHRPLNSALELDLDFERTMRPPPQPTEEATASLEDVIRKRVAERQFDDVVRVAPPPPDTRKTALEMDSKKSTKGLGELYEEEYARKKTGDVIEERDAATKQEARTLLKALFAKLDALSHFHFAPKPVVEEMRVQAEVPALAMEEVAPQVASEAGMRYAGEVFRSEGKGLPQGETELSREERKRIRAGKKRASKKRRAQKDEEKRQRSVAAGGSAVLPDRKSEAEATAADAAQRKSSKKGRKSEYTQSGKVFAKLQDEKAATAAGKRPAAARPTDADGRTPAMFKL